MIDSLNADESDAASAAVNDLNNPEIGLVFEPNRRAFPRLTAREITWLRTVRLKYGPSVSLIDLSVRGALFETKLQLRPGSESALELTGRGTQTVVPFRVVR